MRTAALVVLLCACSSEELGTPMFEETFDVEPDGATWVSSGAVDDAFGSPAPSLRLTTGDASIYVRDEITFSHDTINAVADVASNYYDLTTGNPGRAAASLSIKTPSGGFGVSLISETTENGKFNYGQCGPSSPAVQMASGFDNETFHRLRLQLDRNGAVAMIDDQVICRGTTTELDGQARFGLYGEPDARQPTDGVWVDNLGLYRTSD